jgi:hypothetical protein
MQRQRPERALRRAVTELARLHPDDLALVLDALEPAEKARIDTLIAGLGAPSPPAAEAEPVWTYEGVSPWLRVRIEPATKPGRASREFVVMTEATHAALMIAAAPFRTERPASGPGQSLMSQLWRRLSGTPA